MNNLYHFADFVLDPARHTLTRADSPVSLTPRAFDVLLYLAQNPNRLVTKEELLQGVWGDTIVEEGNLTQYISHLRKALGDSAEDSRLIVTIARRGYQFAADVTVVTGTPESAKSVTLPVATATDPSKIDVTPTRPAFHLLPWSGAAVLLALVAVSIWSYWSYRHRVTLSATDTIVLASVQNQTSDPVFDDALDSALRYEMEQTPYLNILGRDKVLGTLAQLNLPPASRLTPDVALQICGKTNSRMVISQSIGDVGNGYQLQLDRKSVV